MHVFHCVDEETINWRGSAHSSNNKLATSSLDRSKKSTSLQSLNKVNLDGK